MRCVPFRKHVSAVAHFQDASTGGSGVEEKPLRSPRPITARRGALGLDYFRVVAAYLPVPGLPASLRWCAVGRPFLFDASTRSTRHEPTCPSGHHFPRERGGGWCCTRVGVKTSGTYRRPSPVLASASRSSYYLSSDVVAEGGGLGSRSTRFHSNLDSESLSNL